MKERLKLIRKELKLTQAKFAEGIEMAQNSYSQVETGKASLTEKNIALICLKYGIDENWLRTGEGEMMHDETRLSNLERRLIEAYMKLSPTAQLMVIEYAEKLLADECKLRGEY